MPLRMTAYMARPSLLWGITALSCVIDYSVRRLLVGFIRADGKTADIPTNCIRALFSAIVSEFLKFF